MHATAEHKFFFELHLPTSTSGFSSLVSFCSRVGQDNDLLFLGLLEDGSGNVERGIIPKPL